MPARTTRPPIREARTAGRLPESPPTAAFGTTPIGLFPRPPTADQRAASPRPRATSPPTRRPSSPSFGTPQSEPPTLRDIAAPNLAIRSRACLASVSLGRGFVPLSRRTQFARWSGPELRRPNRDAWATRTARKGACRMLTASTKYSLHAKITPRQLMARSYGRERDDHLHRALQPDRCRHQGRQGFTAPARRGQAAPGRHGRRDEAVLHGDGRLRLCRNLRSVG